MTLNYKSSLVRYRKYLAAAEANPVWKKSIFAILSLGLLLFMILFAIRPTVITISELLKQISTQTELSEKLGQKIQNLRDAGEILAQQQNNLKLLDQAVPNRPVWQDWLDAVEGLAAESGVIIITSTVGPITVAGKPAVVGGGFGTTTKSEEIKLPENVTPINFNLVVNGNYFQVKKFTEDLENLKRITIVKEARLIKDKSGIIATTISGVIGYMMSGEPL